MRWRTRCAHCHSVDEFAWAVVGSVAGVVAAAAAIIALIPIWRDRMQLPQPPATAKSRPRPAIAGEGAPVVVGEIPQEPLGYQPRVDLLALLEEFRPDSQDGSY
jgi:hypothetical protein